MSQSQELRFRVLVYKEGTKAYVGVLVKTIECEEYVFLGTVDTSYVRFASTQQLDGSLGIIVVKYHLLQGMLLNGSRKGI